MRQGPHHGAQKSTRTGIDALISSSKPPASVSTIHGRTVWHTLQRGIPSAVGRTRLSVPQLGHVTIVGFAGMSVESRTPAALVKPT
jgi:hypothetical protein